MRMTRLVRADSLLKFVAFFAALFLYLSCFRNAIIDDSYITFTYARNLKETGIWGLFPNEVANTSTSMLNTILTAAAFVFGSHPVAAIALTSLELAGIGFLLIAISEGFFNSPTFGRLAFAAILANPLMISTIGMECFLYALVFLAALRAWQVAATSLMGILLGLGVLVRPDAALWLPIFLIVTLGWKRRLAVVGLFLVPIIPWELFSWIKLGSFLPDTLIIKTAESWGIWNYLNGPVLYLQSFPFETLLSLVTLPFAFLGWRRSCPMAFRFRLIVTATAVIHFVAYSLLGTPPYHWYYVPVVIPIIILGAMGMADVIRRVTQAREKRSHRTELIFLSAFAVIACVPFMEASGLRPKDAPIHSNWAPPSTYRDIGYAIQMVVKKDDPVWLEGELGGIAFYSRRRIYDRLSDRTLLIPWIEEMESR
ncbi:MAG: hypothetical protein ABI579_06880, partial [Candidatus Sumerlaeota bacterium]